MPTICRNSFSLDRLTRRQNSASLQTTSISIRLRQHLISAIGKPQEPAVHDFSHNVAARFDTIRLSGSPNFSAYLSFRCSRPSPSHCYRTPDIYRFYKTTGSSRTHILSQCISGSKIAGHVNNASIMP